MLIERARTYTTLRAPPGKEKGPGGPPAGRPGPAPRAFGAGAGGPGPGPGRFGGGARVAGPGRGGSSRLRPGSRRQVANLPLIGGPGFLLGVGVGGGRARRRGRRPE